MLPINSHLQAQRLGIQHDLGWHNLFIHLFPYQSFPAIRESREVNIFIKSVKKNIEMKKNDFHFPKN